MTYGDQSFTVTQDDVDFSFDTDAVLEEAYQYGRDGDREERYAKVSALAETPVTFEVSADMESGALRSKLEELTAPLNTEPKDASVVSFNAETEQFEFSEGVNGVTVDLDALTEQVTSAIENGVATVEIPVTETPCSLTADDLRQNLKKLGTYSTTSTNTANGNYNMARAMASINGTVVQPGETFSYFGSSAPPARPKATRPPTPSSTASLSRPTAAASARPPRPSTARCCAPASRSLREATTRSLDLLPHRPGRRRELAEHGLQV